MLNQPHTGFTRIPYAQRCRVTRGGATVEGVLCNISVLGVYLTIEPIPPEGEEIRLSFMMPGGGDPVDTAAVVTWQNPDEQRAEGLPPGCGVRFQGLRPPDQKRIEKLVADYRSALPLGVGAAQPYSGFVRVPYLHRCQLMVGAKPHVGVVCNVSALGVYVAVDVIPEVGSNVEVSFMLPRESRRFTSPAVVTWRNPPEAPRVDRMPPGCGLRFLTLPAEERARIERLVLEYEYCATVAAPKNDATSR